MPKRKEPATIKKYRNKLIAHMDEVTRMTPGQLNKNHNPIIDKFHLYNIHLLTALNNHFDPPTKEEAPDDGE